MRGRGRRGGLLLGGSDGFGGVVGGMGMVVKAGLGLFESGLRGCCV